MAKYLIKLTPLQDYFLGKERSNAFTGKVDGYFTESEDIPSQTTLLGLIRYLVLKKNDCLSEYGMKQEKIKMQQKLVGKSSFNIDVSGQEFGIIKAIGPLFFIDDNNEFYVHTPFNHKKCTNRECGKRINKKYTPFCMGLIEEGITDIQTGKSDIEKYTILPIDYESKDGIADNFIQLDNDLKIIKWSDIFLESVKVRINRNNQEDGFFKKKYKNLQQGWHFAFYIDINDDEFEMCDTVYMGQEKSAFYFESIKEKEDIHSRSTLFEEHINKLRKIKIPMPQIEQEITTYYALSDIYFRNDLPQNIIKYSIIKKRLARNLMTDIQSNNYYGRYKKSNMYELIRAGSIFWVTDSNEFIRICEDKQYTQIGLNQIVEIGGK